MRWWGRFVAYLSQGPLRLAPKHPTYIAIKAIEKVITTLHPISKNARHCRISDDIVFEPGHSAI